MGSALFEQCRNLSWLAMENDSEKPNKTALSRLLATGRHSCVLRCAHNLTLRDLPVLALWIFARYKGRRRQRGPDTEDLTSVEPCHCFQRGDWSLGRNDPQRAVPIKCRPDVMQDIIVLREVVSTPCGGAYNVCPR